MRADALESIPRRDQKQAGDKVGLARCSRCSYRGAERLAHQQQRRAVLAMGERDGLFGIARQTLFAARAVARVLGKDRPPPERRERGGIEIPMARMPSVAVKGDGRGRNAARSFFVATPKRRA